jgi:hypothetical protein
MLITVHVAASGGATKAITLDVPVTSPAPSPSPVAPMPLGVPGNWTLAFEDTFDGTALDLNKWSSSWFNGGTMNKVKTSPANVAVTDGNLVLTLSDSATGALVSTNPKGGAKTGYQFTTGYVEARIWFPGNGTANSCYNWPAWWTDGQSWPGNGEHDIAEVLGGQMTVNYHSASGAHNQGAVPGVWNNGWHVYGLWRKGSTAEVYYDGKLVKSYPTDDGNAPQYLILNVGNGGSPNVYGAASQVRVDYVRAWQ